MATAGESNVAGPGRPTRDVAILCVTHQWLPSVARRFARLRAEVAGEADCLVLLQDDRGPVTARWTAFLRSLGAADALVPFSPDALPGQLGYACFNAENLMFGCTHFPLLRFARSAGYRFYWMVESDVEYRGHWGALFEAIRRSEASLLATHVQSYGERPRWHWWASLSPPPAAGHGWALDPARLHKAFFPVSRFSAEALRLVDDAHREGWRGHFEALIPTVLHLRGHDILDLRNLCPCYFAGSQEPTPDLRRLASMRWRPEVSVEEFVWRGSEPVLFHPVKQDWWFDGGRVVRYASGGAGPK